MTAGTGIPALGAVSADPCAPAFCIPYDGTEPEFPFWGPTGANVIEGPNGPYKISYTLVNDPAQTLGTGSVPAIPPVNVWVITVSAVPTDVAGATLYFGIDYRTGGATHAAKRVDYVAQFTQ